MKREEALRDKLLTTFNLEAAQRLRRLTECLAQMQQAPETEFQAALVEEVYREAHSLKGAARSVNLPDVEAICRSLEDLFLACKKRRTVMGSAHFDLLYRVCGTLEDFLAAPQVQRDSFAITLDTLGHQLKSHAQGAPSPALEPRQRQTKVAAPSARPHPSLVTRAEPATTRKLDALLFAAEELTPAKNLARQRATEGRALQKQLGEWQQDWARGVPALEMLSADHGEHRRVSVTPFIDGQQKLGLKLKAAVEILSLNLERDHRSLVRMVEALQRETKTARLLPAADVFGAYPRMVREIAAEQGKEVAFELDGAAIEIDRTVLEAMKDPVLHLVRNCLDHGIETPAIREQAGKPRLGTIRVMIRPRSEGTVLIQVSDDGAGIDVEAIKRAAAKMTLADDVDSLSREQASPPARSSRTFPDEGWV
jgi:two-component system chemotaxis sensor kinase CheA